MATMKTPEPSLDRVRAALTGIGKDVRTGGRDLYGDLAVFVKAARKDTEKLGKALRGDTERLIKAAVGLPPAKPAAKQRHTAPRRARKAPPAAPRARTTHA